MTYEEVFSAPEPLQLPHEEQVRRAYDLILRSASAREVSSAKMTAKLSRKGFSSQVIAEALDSAQQIGAVDDVRYCNCLIRTTLSQGKGLSFALREVESLGLIPEDLEAFQAFQEDEEAGMFDRALDLLRRHPTRSKNVRGAAYKKLIAAGYSPDIASDASTAYAKEARLAAGH